MKNRVKIVGVITLRSPLSHGADEKMGTDTKFRRMTYMVSGEPMDVPIISGNSIRGQMRRVAAMDFLERLGLAKEKLLTDSLYYMMFSGGALEKGAGKPYIDIGSKRQLREMMPFMSLFGGAIENQIMAGKLEVDHAIPICSELIEYTNIEEKKSFWDMLEEIYYTRRDDLEEKSGEVKTQQMKYTTECLSAGTRLLHGFTLNYVNEVEEACFYNALRLWIEKDSIGGLSAIGHGRFRGGYLIDQKIEIEKADISAYGKYMEENKKKLTDYVHRLEQPKTLKPSKTQNENSSD
ncbi:MAG: hypothetical protein KKE64_08260 [Candidatus Omnitrophica bacterium]|nr:hypothetical protein [Candidatus Omnitrophota bacterium]